MVRGLLAAKFLGPQLLGVFGFLSLMLQYLAYCGLGLQYAINVELATDPKADHQSSISVTLTLSALIALVLMIAGVAVQVFGLILFDKYSFHQYASVVGFTAGATVLQQVYTNIYRVYGRLAEVAISELFSAVVLIVVVFGFRAEALLSALLIGLALSAAFSIVLFMARAPFRLSLCLDQYWTRALLKMGLPLLFYNASFYLIAMVAQTVIGIYYSVIAMGYYTFAGSVANAILLGFNSISWVVFPNILARTRLDLPDDETLRTTDRVNVLFGTGVFLVVFAGLLLLPALFFVLPSYAPSYGALTILLLSQGLLSSSFGYNCLAIARRRQMAVAKISLGSVLVVGCLAVLFGMLKLPFLWVAVAVLLGSFVFTALQSRLGASLIVGGRERFRSILPFSTIVAIALCAGGVLVRHPFIGALGGSIGFVFGNRSRVFELLRLLKPYIAAIFLLRSPQAAAVQEPVIGELN
jgi:O-antigen/teichoic acid export membrane protein